MRAPIDRRPLRAAETRQLGYILLYHKDVANVCPGCGKRQWFIGRTTAECAFCDTALPLGHNEDGGNARLFTVSKNRLFSA